MTKDAVESGEDTPTQNGQTPSQETAMAGLTTIPTSVTLTAEQFEKLYLNPLKGRQGAMTRKFGNPTPLALASLVVTVMPVSAALMGWRGAGGTGMAFIGAMVFLAGTMLVISGLLEFVLGNTFPCVVFGTFAPYSSSGTSTMEGLTSPEFMNTYAFLFLAMDILCFIYMICATRINAVFVAIFLTLVMVFTLLSAAYWRLGLGDAVGGNRLLVAGGASLFVASMLVWYLLIAQLFEAVGIPLSLPVGDMSRVVTNILPLPALMSSLPVDADISIKATFHVKLSHTRFQPSDGIRNNAAMSASKGAIDSTGDHHGNHSPNVDHFPQPPGFDLGSRKGHVAIPNSPPIDIPSSGSSASMAAA
ncbi:GPR1/FUN34/YaaH-class plasma membrane protein [Rasamsonia emersonii CBS 393.64]|uniref:GPR1/FUN34/YaaH-class plasma membrane protein n=1 Tax=Rasamsonia emersonii (strain ATCC 16479 / CBS 393.64 / IMI 116815) TaxID=1408163 RepID=A0A0F4YQY9_RASE3|nr:GPR1/FUN34/YaaH-class plasma membrane protein [Rasamsonia emersonii CBS 393.64]KKA20053.1 GPR1/FUN34/YaaH-class plasma membrane protein [Rasamsonia emersonii CBS 393.64]